MAETQLPLAAQWTQHLLVRGTGGDLPSPQADGPLPDAEWAEVVAQVQAGRITWALLDAVVSADLATTDDQARAARTYHQQAMAVAVRLEQLLRTAGGVLRSAGVEHRVLKGPAVAWLDAAAPEQRDFGDIDLLVPSDAVPRALRALGSVGITRIVPPMRLRLDRMLHKGVALRDPRGFEVDLHRSLFPGAFALGTPETVLWARSEEFQVGGDRFLALDSCARTVHTAGHLVLGGANPRLSTARDLVIQIYRHPKAEDVVARGAALKATAVLGAALDALLYLGIPLPAAWDTLARQGALRGTQQEQLQLAKHLAAQGSYRAQTQQAIRALPPLQRWSARAALAFPRREHLRARETTRMGHLRRVTARSGRGHPGRPGSGS